MSRKDHAGLFKKGKSGNPGGRPKLEAWVREELSKSLKDCVKVANELLQHDDAKVRITAVKEIFDRTIGKAPQAVEVSGPEGEAIFQVVISEKKSGQ